jgi:hypothetical protein
MVLFVVQRWHVGDSIRILSNHPRYDYNSSDLELRGARALIREYLTKDPALDVSQTQISDTRALHCFHACSTEIDAMSGLRDLADSR